MDNIRNSKIDAVVDVVSRVTQDEEFKKSFLEKAQTMEDMDIINELNEYVSGKNDLDPELSDYLYTYIRNVNPVIAPSIDEVKVNLKKFKPAEKIEKTEDTTLEVPQMSLEENHKMLKRALKRYSDLFNKEGIDYYLVGAVPAYLQLGLPFERCHDDLDFMINEEDIDKVKVLFEEGSYEFHDDRFPDADRVKELAEKKISYSLMAQNKFNAFHIGFFPFTREQDNGITLKEYEHKLSFDTVLTNIILRYYDEEGTKLRYGNDIVDVDGIKCKMCTLENIYDMKSYTRRPKDVEDMNNIESYVDKNLLKELRRHTNKKDIIKNAQLDSMVL